MPFGETFVEEKSNGNFSNPYKFSGQELDKNTGFYLFGARYYNPKTSLWLSLDPLAELFPSVGGYVYSYNNPVMFNDLSGLEPDPKGDADCPTCKTKKTENVHGTLENPVELQEVVFKKKKEASTAQKVGEFAIGFVPIVGSVYDIYQGVKNGDNLQLALGVGGLLLDVATLGSGSLLKGGLKAGLKNGLKSGTKGIGLELAGVQVTKNALKNSADDVAKVGLYSATTGAAKSVGKNLPTQIHHFATNKHSFWTEKMEDIVKNYGLSLDGAWNKAAMPHLGRHPELYHQFVYDNMLKAKKIAGGNKEKFLQLFDELVKKPILNNPELLRKLGW